MNGCPAVALDTHVYQAWFDARGQQEFLADACSWRQRLREVHSACACVPSSYPSPAAGAWPATPSMAAGACACASAPTCCRPWPQVQQSTLPVLVGEWSLATDNCQMWLNGFHDNAPGYPKVECGTTPCPEPYVTGVRGPPTAGSAPGPFGTGTSAPKDGMCPVSKPWDNEAAMETKLAQARRAVTRQPVTP